MLTLGCQYKEKRCIQKESDPKEHFEEQLTQGKKKVHRAAKKPNMSPVLSAVILFCISMVTVSHACSCLPSDTQEDFCRAAIGKLHLI